MKILLLNILSLIVFSCLSQQHTSFTQYRINKFALNPAVAGSKPCDNLNFGSRLQWVGFEGAPQLYFASLHSRFNKTERAPKHKQGFGFYLAQDNEGIQENTILKIAYSYHFPLGKNFEAGIGMFLGAQKKALENVVLHTPSGVVDPAFDEGNVEYVFPEISPGIYIHGNKLYTGLSIMQVYPIKMKKIGTSKANLSPHFFWMGGYDIGKYSWTFTPAFLLSAMPQVPPTLDVSISADYRDKFLLSIGGKYANSVYFTAHIRLFKWLKVAYTYSYPISKVNNIAANSQSITINISGCDSFVERPPFYCPVYR